MLAAAPAVAAPAGGGTVLFRFADERITESSSLVASTRADLVWTANDSGDVPRLFAVGPDGRTLAVARVPGTAQDLEDAAAGPGGTLYLADTGDNRARRRSVAVLVVPEPAVDPRGGDVALTTAAPRRAALTYEDGPHDAETLLVHPRTGQVLVVTKGLLGSAAYAAPLPLSDGVLRRVADVPLRPTGTAGGPAPGGAAQLLATGGAVSGDGRRLVVRTYTDAYLWDVPGEDLVAALQGAPTVLPLPAAPQGEAVTFTSDGSALLLSSEGRGAAVVRVPLPAVAAAATPAVPPVAAPAPEPAPDPAPPVTTTTSRRALVPLLAAVGALAVLSLVARRGRRGRG